MKHIRQFQLPLFVICQYSFLFVDTLSSSICRSSNNLSQKITTLVHYSRRTSAFSILHNFNELNESPVYDKVTYTKSPKNSLQLPTSSQISTCFKRMLDGYCKSPSSLYHKFVKPERSHEHSTNDEPQPANHQYMTTATVLNCIV
jgi:hypothetical protein